MNLQIEFAKNKIYKTVNTHYKELNKIIKKMKNIIIYINALQIEKKKIKIKITVVFTYNLIKCIKTINVFSKIIIIKVKL
jgi:hypothetical protein